MELMHKFKLNEHDTFREVVFFGAEGTQDWAVCCWDLRSKTIKTSYKGNSSKAQTLSLISGEYVISADACKPLLHIWALNKRVCCLLFCSVDTVRCFYPLFDGSTGTSKDLFLRITCGGLVTALAVTSDGAYCAVATSMMIKIWQVSTGEVMASFETSQVNYLQFARNSKYLFSGESSTVCVWPFAKILSNPKESIECVYKFMHDNSVSGIKCGSTSVLTAADRAVTLWSLRNGSQIRNVWLESAVSALEWGPKEDRAFAGTYNGDIYEINTQSERDSPKKFVYVRSEKKQVRGLSFKKDRRVTCLSLSLDGRILVSGSLKGKVYLWNTHTRYLVTSVHLNVTGTITSCLVASVPYEFEKPVQPLTKFQLERKTETEGKVKILLQNQKHDLELNLDFSDDKFEKFVAKGLSLLDEFGKSENKSEQYAKNWIRLTEQLMSGLHDVLDQLYSDVETDPKRFARPPPGLVKLKPVPEEEEDNTKVLSVLQLQFERLCVALSAMISGCGLEYPCVVEFPLKYVTDLLERTIAMTPPYLLRKTSNLRTDLASVIPFLHIAALRLLRSLMISVKSALLSSVETINAKLLLPGLGWSKSCASGKPAYKELRCEIYETIRTSTIYGLSGDCKSYESFFKTVIYDAATDAKPLFETTEKQEARSEKMLNRVNTYWLQVAAKNKRKSTGLMTKTKTDSTNELKNEEERLANEKLNTTALKVLKRLVASEGRLLSRSILEVIVNLLRQLYPRLSTFDSTSALAFHALVTSIVMVAPSLPFTLELPLEVSTPRLYDDDAEEIRQFYLSSLCRDAKIVEREESSVDLANSATVAKLSESTSKSASNCDNSLPLNPKRQFVEEEEEEEDEPSSSAKKTKLDEDLGALKIPPSVIRASSADLAEEVVSDYSTPSELPESETKINDRETRIQEKEIEIECEVTHMDTSLGCETAVVDISSAVPHNESTIVPSSSKTEPTVEVNSTNTLVDSEAEEDDLVLEELINAHNHEDQ